jgi:hypothetical protein
MSAVVVDMYRGHASDMDLDDGESKSMHAAISVEDVNSFLAAQKLQFRRTTSEPPKEKRVSRTYQFSDRDIRRYQQARKEGRLRFPDLFMYHIQRPTDDIQREARVARNMEEKEEAEKIAAEISAACASNAVLEVISEDQPPVRIAISGNAGIMSLEQHSSHHCDESMALKSEVSEQAGKLSLAPGAVVGASGVSSGGITQTQEDMTSKEKPTKRKYKIGKLVVQGKLGKKVIPIVIVAAAGFAGVLIVTSSVGIGFAVAIPCAAITYGSIKLYEHCKKKKMLKNSKHSKKDSAAESAPLASKIELADH